MGLFSKKKPEEPIPRPNPPFMPNQPMPDSILLKDQLNLDQVEPAPELPPLPADVSTEPAQINDNLNAVADKMLDEKGNKKKYLDMNDMLKLHGEID